MRKVVSFPPSTFFIVLAVVLFPTLALAQTVLEPLPRETPLSRVVYELYVQEIEANEGSESDLADSLALTQALSAQLSTFPLGSSAGGFAWTFDPSNGVFTRTTGSFGPIFAERALTVGRNKLNFGINYMRATFDEFEELELRDGEIKFFTDFGNQLYGEDSLRLKVSSDTVGFFLNYGLTDRLDVGLAMPLVRVDMDASLRFIFVNRQGVQVGNTDEIRSGGRSKTGFGDAVVRAKYNVFQQPGGGVAVGLDLRLPTGDEDNLIGIPGTQAKIYGVYSAAFGKINPHVNVGYTFSRGNDAAADPDSVLFAPPDEFNYTAGVDFAIQPRLTVAVDIVGRTLRDIFRLELGDPFGLGPRFNEFELADETTLNSALTSLGVKYNVYGNLLLTANVLFPVTKGGLRDKFTPLFGLDYSF
jgi:Putative MetA-pathway of phenol degradation